MGRGRHASQRSSCGRLRRRKAVGYRDEPAAGRPSPRGRRLLRLLGSFPPRQHRHGGVSVQAAVRVETHVVTGDAAKPDGHLRLRAAHHQPTKQGRGIPGVLLRRFRRIADADGVPARSRTTESSRVSRLSQARTSHEGVGAGSPSCVPTSDVSRPVAEIRTPNGSELGDGSTGPDGSRSGFRSTSAPGRLCRRDPARFRSHGA